MSVTFYVKDWDKQESVEKKVYVKELYPNLCESKEDEEFYFANEFNTFKDEKGYYEIRTVYKNPFPELNLSNRKASILLNEVMPHKNYVSDSFSHNDINLALKSIFKIKNTNKINNIKVDSYVKNNFVDAGISEKEAERMLESLWGILLFARNINKTVYWG